MKKIRNANALNKNVVKNTRHKKFVDSLIKIKWKEFKVKMMIKDKQKVMSLIVCIMFIKT